MLAKRIVTALILIPLVLLANFYLPPAPFTIITAMVFLLAGWEMARLIGYTTRRGCLLYLAYLFVALLIALLLPAIVAIVTALILWAFMLYFVLHYARFTQWWGRSLVIRTLVSIGLLATSWFSLIFIHVQPHGSYYVLFMLLFVWAADTGAYFSGRRWGRHKLAPDISPGKSVEGVIGGVIVSLIVASVICALIPFRWSDCITLLLLAMIASLASVLGDLTESMIKRCADMKDSGQLLPGHGGLLDRIDSLLCVTPVLATGLLAWSIIGLLS